MFSAMFSAGPAVTRLQAATLAAAFASALAATLLAPSSARAIDCRKAASPLERMICADPALRKADAALGAAYSGLLHSTDDAEIRAMLIASQKRWVAARDTWLGDLDAADARAVVLKAIRARTEDLSGRSKSDPARPHWIAAALRQRAFAARFTGGPFAGFDTACDFLPVGRDRVYGCFGSRRYQNGDRVCTLSDDWASGHTSETRTVARVVDGAARTVATCTIGGGDDAECPGPDNADGRWARPAAPAAAGAAAAPPGPPPPPAGGLAPGGAGAAPPPPPPPPGGPAPPPRPPPARRRHPRALGPSSTSSWPRTPMPRPGSRPA
ncbi:lysozyme inhibitor LprI family protein [Methylobacterium sp. A52T]